MSYEIEVNLPNIPKGEKVEIAGLGEFENGKTSTIDPDRLELFKLNNTRREPNEDGELVVVEEGTALGKLVFPLGVTIKTAKKSSGGSGQGGQGGSES